MENENVKEQVMEAISTPAEAAPANEWEAVSSWEVKPEVTPEVPKVETPAETPKSEDKTSEQITNLNTALAIERDEKKKLREELESVKTFQEKLKSAFEPQAPAAPENPAQTEQEKFEEWYAQKELEKDAEKKTAELQKTITTQIETLSNEWNWEWGKPKYDDAEVYKWQKENGKTHLTPEEAFFLMKRDDLIDYKSKQILEKANSSVPSVILIDQSPPWCAVTLSSV